MTAYPLEGSRADMVYNPPGCPALQWRVAAHPDSLARMRATLTADDQPTAVRALSQHDTADPAIALLDGWALVADVVSFYTERIANEGYLRTATERTSLRELARTLGHELRPGVAAQADLAFVVEDASGAPTEVVVPRGTPVQTVPGANQMPQVFETSAELVARAVWNAIPGAPDVAQPRPTDPTAPMWVAATGLGLRIGDPILVGDREAGPVALRTVAELTENPTGRPGWTLLTLVARPGSATGPPSSTKPELTLHTFDNHTFLFGWNAPDPTLLRGSAGSSPAESHGEWADFGMLHDGYIELDGDHPELLADTWLAFEDAAGVVIDSARTVVPGAASRYGLSTRITRITTHLTTDHQLDLDSLGFKRRSTVVHIASRQLTAATAPRTAKVSGTTIELAVVDPPLPRGRLVVVTGYSPDAVPSEGATTSVPAPPFAETARVTSCTVNPVTAVMTVVLDPPLRHEYDPLSLRVQANIVEATHGETVTQVLGSGDGRPGFTRFPLRRGPLTHLRASTPTGVRSSLEVRVDDVIWAEVESLADVLGDERAISVREEEDGTATVTFGDGAHGARVPSGLENVTATYRVGMGINGAAEPGQLSMLLRRPFGIRSVSNPGPAGDYAARETTDQARITAPLRVRTLDRIVSVADYGDLAQGFAGVETATATAVWNGQHHVVTVSVLGADASASTDLLVDLRAALDALRDPSAPLAVLPSRVVKFGAQFAIRTDPAYWRPEVEDGVRTRLMAEFGAGHWGIATPVTPARVLVAIRSVPGVLAAECPRLLALSDDPTSPAPAAPNGRAGRNPIDARPARWEGNEILAAETAVLAEAHTTIGTMP